MTKDRAFKTVGPAAGEKSTSMKTKGILFLIVGNSGSGKDTLIRRVEKTWPTNQPRPHFPRRHVTRPPHPSETFISVSKKQFKKLERSGEFCLSWSIFGIDYGITRKVYRWLNNGEHVLVNVSRSVISRAKTRFDEIRVIFVSVPIETTLSRLTCRGREKPDDPAFMERVARAMDNPTFPDADLVIDNCLPLEKNTRILTDYIASF